MGILDSIWSAGEELLGGGNSSFDDIVGSVIGSVGEGGFGDIVNQVTGSTGGFWGAVNTVVEDQLGEEYGGLINGIKDVASGDTDNLIGTVVGGVRDYVGEDRFDGIAGAIGEAVNGQTDGWMSELQDHITTAVGNDGFTAVMDGVSEVIGEETGDQWISGILGEVRVAVGEDTWEIVETASGYANEAAEDDDVETLNPFEDDEPEIGDVDLMNPFEDDEDDTGDDEILNPFEDDESEIGDDGLINPFEDETIGGPDLSRPLDEGRGIYNPIDPERVEVPDSPFGDTPLEDILEDSPVPTGAVDSPFGDTPLEDILEDSVSPVGAIPIMTTQPVEAAASMIEADMPTMTTAVVEPGPLDTFVAPVIEAPVVVEAVAPAPTAFEAADDFSETVDDFFDGLA